MTGRTSAPRARAARPVRSPAAPVRRALSARVRRAHAAGDSGNAVVEFLGVALILLVPTVYLVLVLGRLQSAAFAVDGAAREAVRAYVTTSAVAPDASAAGQRAVAAVHVALADQGLAQTPAVDALALTCAGSCGPGDDVVARVEVAVPLPFVPGWLQGAVPLVVPVSATATGVLDTFAAAR